ncbi:MAG: site-specific integrase [Pyrinomonadaceae bacterium]
MIKKQWSERFGRDVWGYEARIGGVRKRKFGFATRGAAEAALSAARVTAYEKKQGVAPPEAAPSITVRALVERRAAQLQQTPRRKTSARLLARWLGTLPPGLLVTELTTAHLQAYVDARLREAKQQTVFRELTDISTCLNRARDLFSGLEGWAPPRRPRNVRQGHARDRLLSAEEVSKVLAHLRRPAGRHEWRNARGLEWEGYVRLRHDAADLLQIALLSAARRSEILSLRWSDVDFERGALRITGTKTDRVRVIPAPRPLVALLERRRRETAGSPLVFPAAGGRVALQRANTEKIFRAAGRAVGVPYGRDTPGGWVLHDARHTAITAMLHAGNSLESVMAISGHSARVMAMRYAHSTEATRRAAVSALDQFAGEISYAFSSTPPTNPTDMSAETPTRDGGKAQKSRAKPKKSVKTRTARA